MYNYFSREAIKSCGEDFKDPILRPALHSRGHWQSHVITHADLCRKCIKMHEEGKRPALASTFVSEEDAVELISKVLLKETSIKEIESWLCGDAEEPRHTIYCRFSEITGECVVFGRDFQKPYQLHGVAVVLIRSKNSSYEVLTAFPYNTADDNGLIFPNW